MCVGGSSLAVPVLAIAGDSGSVLEGDTEVAVVELGAALGVAVEAILDEVLLVVPPFVESLLDLLFGGFQQLGDIDVDVLLLAFSFNFLIQSLLSSEASANLVNCSWVLRFISVRRLVRRVKAHILWTQRSKLILSFLMAVS